MKKLIGKKDYKFLFFLTLMHAIFFTMALLYKRIYTGDSFEYVYMAINIKEQGWLYCGNPALPLVTEYLTLRQPVYPLFLMLVYLFTVNNWVVILIQNLVSIFNILYLRRTMRTIGYKRKYDYFFLALVILYPAQFIHCNTIAPDILLQTSVLVYFHHFVLLIKRRSWEHALCMSFALCAGLFIKPVLYPFTIVHCFMLLALATYFRIGLFRLSFAAVLPLVVIMAYMSWNGQRTGKAHFSSNQSFNAIYYYYFYFVKTKGIDEAKVFLAKERSKIESMPDFEDRYNYANKRGIELLKANFVPYMGFHLLNSGRLLIDPGKGELDMFVGKQTLGQLYKNPKEGFWSSYRKGGYSGVKNYIADNPTFAMSLVVLVFNFLRLIGLVLFLFNRKQKILIRVFVAGIVAYFAITTGPIANTRYFLPVSLIVIGCAAYGYQKLLLRSRKKYSTVA